MLRAPGPPLGTGTPSGTHRHRVRTGTGSGHHRSPSPIATVTLRGPKPGPGLGASPGSAFGCLLPSRRMEPRQRSPSCKGSVCQAGSSWCPQFSGHGWARWWLSPPPLSTFGVGAKSGVASVPPLSASVGFDLMRGQRRRLYLIACRQTRAELRPGPRAMTPVGYGHVDARPGFRGGRVRDARAARP